MTTNQWPRQWHWGGENEGDYDDDSDTDYDHDLDEHYVDDNKRNVFDNDSCNDKYDNVHDDEYYDFDDHNDTEEENTLQMVFVTMEGGTVTV